MSIQHKPNERVQLRASIHSGSVMAGIQVIQKIGIYLVHFIQIFCMIKLVERW